MALFDKLSEIAKNVGDMTNDALENSRKNSQISAENKKIRQLKEEIGDYYFGKYKNAETLDEPVIGLCTQITASQEIISTLKAEIESVGRQTVAEQEESKKFCTQCGAKNNVGAKFCVGCGTGLED